MRTTLLNTNTRLQVEGVTMTNHLLVENGINLDKIGESEGIRNDNNPTNSIEEDADIENGPGKLDKEENTVNIIQGIHFHTILETIPGEFRLNASEYFLTHNIAETLSTKIIPYWNQEQRGEAVQQVLAGKQDGTFAKILIKLFKINEHIESTRSHKQFIEKTFYRFQSVFKHLEEKTILAHDQSKLRY